MVVTFSLRAKIRKIYFARETQTQEIKPNTPPTPVDVVIFSRTQVTTNQKKKTDSDTT
jgi:hypothetical protein